MKTINIHGKQYVEVNERIKYFRKHFKGWALTTEFVELTDEKCTIKAAILDDKGCLISNGVASETKGSSFINKTSYIENCETSAWGRALGNLGIGLDVAIASADEVLNAKAQDKKNDAKTSKPVGKITMNVRVLENMLKGIADGKSKQVKESMSKYDMTKEQEKTLTVMINTTK
jgi:hypothetical protein